MTRKELIKSDEYITASVECIVTPRKPLGAVRKELNSFFIELRNELLQPENETIPTVSNVDSGKIEDASEEEAGLHFSRRYSPDAFIAWKICFKVGANWQANKSK